MPDDLFSMVVAGEGGLFEHLAKDEISILSGYVREKSDAVNRGGNLAVHGKSVGNR